MPHILLTFTLAAVLAVGTIGLLGAGVGLIYETCVAN